MRYAVALHSVALRFPGFGGVSQGNGATPTEKGPAAPTFSALKGGVALQVASWKVSRYRGCRSYTVACRATKGHLVSLSLKDERGIFLTFWLVLCCLLISVPPSTQLVPRRKCRVTLSYSCAWTHCRSSLVKTSWHFPNPPT